MSIGQKFELVADAVYEKGKTDIISNSKYIEKQATGKAIRLDDVSEIPHKVRIKAGATSKNLYDNSKARRTMDDGSIAVRVQSGYFIPVEHNTDYILSAINVTTQPKYGVKGITKEEFVENPTWTQMWSVGVQILGNSNTSFNTGNYDFIVFRTWAENSVYGITEDTLFQLEKGKTVTPYEPFKEPSTEPAEVEVYGKNLFDISADARLTKQADGSYVNNAKLNISQNSLHLPNNFYVFACDLLSAVGNNVRICFYLVDGSRIEEYVASTGGYVHQEIVINGEIVGWGFYYAAAPSAGTVFIKNPQLELYDASPYEEFKEPQTIIATPEGVEIPSDCEGMYLIADNDITVDYWGSYGKITSLRKWWYDYTKNMPNNGAPNAFSYYHWTDSTFNPQNDMACSSANNMFASSRIRNIRGILKRNKVNLIFLDTLSNHTQFFSIFTNAHVMYLPYLKLPTTSTAYGWFTGCSKLIEVDGYECTENHAFETSSGANKTFQGCTELVKIIFHGTVGKNCDIHWSTKLSRESILSLLQVLKASVTGVTITLPTKCIDTATDTLALIQGDTELNTAYTQALANGYSIAFQ